MRAFSDNECQFLATLVALHLTPVSESVSEWAEFRTSVASRLASLFSAKFEFDANNQINGSV